MATPLPLAVAPFDLAAGAPRFCQRAFSATAFKTSVPRLSSDK